MSLWRTPLLRMYIHIYISIHRGEPKERWVDAPRTVVHATLDINRRLRSDRACI